MTHPAIPQTDPRAGYQEQRDAIDAAIARVLAGGQYILGREVAAFEADFAAWLGVGHAVGAGSGTDAIELALRACDIGAGDLVFTVSHTAVATVAAIERAGAIPVLVDIAPGGFTIVLNDDEREPLDPATLEIGADNVLYARVKGGTSRARFMRNAYYHLSPSFEAEEHGGFSIVTRGRRYPLPRAGAPGGED